MQTDGICDMGSQCMYSHSPKQLRRPPPPPPPPPPLSTEEVYSPVFKPTCTETEDIGMAALPSQDIGMLPIPSQEVALLEATHWVAVKTVMSVLEADFFSSISFY